MQTQRHDRYVPAPGYRPPTRSYDRPEHKRQTADEIRRVIKPGGRLRGADRGRPDGSRMRLVFFSVQLLDGFETTGESVRGSLPEILQRSEFVDARVHTIFDTLCGSLSLYSASKEYVAHVAREAGRTETCRRTTA